LEQLHRRGILHRDVKPGNIVYSRTGLPKLVDFDLARLAHDPRSDSWEVVPRHGGRSRRDSSSSSSYPSLRRADWMESLYYRSPETVAGAPPDESADLWSLHAVLYECLSGRKVFEARKLPDLLREIREAPIPSLDESLENAPAMLTGYFAAALDRDPSKRPSSAREARQALARMQQIGAH
jgi:eukaryotic-like serine/threonine-protein kinase